MKLRVVELLLVSTLPAMVLAEQGLPKLSVTLATLIGGTLAAGAANAFNQVMEQDLDVAMGRTSKRPLVVGAISTRLALSFAGLLALISLAIFWVFTNPLATVLTLIAIAFYVGIYTAVLKRRTPQNIVWGGIAGCMPVLIGWAAVTNSLSLSAFLLFLLIFFWTPPHFWALAIKYKEDYSRANVPMLPVVAAERIVTRQMLAHAVAMIASSIALGVVAALPTWYFVIAVLLGIYFLYLVQRLRTEDMQLRNRIAEKIFHGSISYLSVISLAIVLAVLV
jgi:protoheme IX farnesyltransferase